MKHCGQCLTHKSCWEEWHHVLLHTCWPDVWCSGVLVLGYLSWEGGRFSSGLSTSACGLHGKGVSAQKLRNRTSGS